MMFETNGHNNADENYGHKAITANRAALFFLNKLNRYVVFRLVLWAEAVGAVLMFERGFEKGEKMLCECDETQSH